jgi:DNA-binding Lrp family transcriptional regulator
MSEEQGEYTFGKGYNTEEIIKELPSTFTGFTPAPDHLIKLYGYVTALVWGRIWRYCQMSDGVCRAKLETIANELGMSERTIIRHVEPLVVDGFLKDITPDLKNRPHIYADTGKLRIKISVETTVTESQSRVTKSQSTMTESHRQGDRESVEESIKKEVKEKKNHLDAFATLRKIILGSLTIENAISIGVPVTEDMRKAAAARDQAPKAFEGALGFSTALPWWSNKDWTDFSVWVVERYIADPRIFERYEKWRTTPFVKGAISNQRIRGFIKEFYDSFDMFAKTVKPASQEINPAPIVVDSPYARSYDTPPEPPSAEFLARKQEIFDRMNKKKANA